MQKLHFVRLWLLVLAALPLEHSLCAKPIPADTVVKSIYLDASRCEEEGLNIVYSPIPSIVVDWLTAQGYEVITSGNKISNRGRLVLTYAMQWDFDKNDAYIKLITAKLSANGNTLGSITVNHPVKEGSVRRSAELYGVVNECMGELFKECHPTQKDLGKDPKPDRLPPHPSSMLKPMDGDAVANLTKTLAQVKYPILMKDLIEQLGGKSRVHRLLDETKDVRGKRVFVAEFVLSDVTAREGYLVLDLYSDEVPPHGTKYDDVVVNGAYLLYHTPFGMNFVKAPKEMYIPNRSP